jgi:hypothetical protein
MGNGLGICRDAVMLLGSEVDVLRAKTGHYVLYKCEIVIGCAMLNQN